MDFILEKWEEIILTLKEEHELLDVSFNSWIRPLEVYGVDGNDIYILLPPQHSDAMTLNYITKK